jgi:hypothetical protein
MSMEEHVVMCMSDYRRRLDWRLDLLTTLTHDYSAIADFHTLQITTAHAKSFVSAVSLPVIRW